MDEEKGNSSETEVSISRGVATQGFPTSPKIIFVKVGLLLLFLTAIVTYLLLQADGDPEPELTGDPQEIFQ